MGRYRLEKINNLIKRELSHIISEHIERAKDNFITVVAVNTSPDLSYANVYISALKDEDQIIETLNKRSPFLRALLGKKVRLRKIPQLRFEKDITQKIITGM